MDSDSLHCIESTQETTCFSNSFPNRKAGLVWHHFKQTTLCLLSSTPLLQPQTDLNQGLTKNWGGGGSHKQLTGQTSMSWEAAYVCPTLLHPGVFQMCWICSFQNCQPLGPKLAVAIPTHMSYSRERLLCPVTIERHE